MPGENEQDPQPEHPEVDDLERLPDERLHREPTNIEGVDDLVTEAGEYEAPESGRSAPDILRVRERQRRPLEDDE